MECGGKQSVTPLLPSAGQRGRRQRHHGVVINLTLIPVTPEVPLPGGIRSNTSFKICMGGLPGTNQVMRGDPPGRFYYAVRVP